MTALSTPTRVRIPFFWWQNEAARTKPAAEKISYLRCDTEYIPSGTADLWRTARRPAAA